MKWHNLGIKTLPRTICDPNAFQKLPRNQITTNFIYPTSSNFVTISQINYWEQKNSWKFWNGPLCINKSGPCPYSMLQHIERVATPKFTPINSLRYFLTILIIGDGGWSQNSCEIFYRSICIGSFKYQSYLYSKNLQIASFNGNRSTSIKKKFRKVNIFSFQMIQNLLWSLSILSFRVPPLRINKSW